MKFTLGIASVVGALHKAISIQAQIAALTNKNQIRRLFFGLTMLACGSFALASACMFEDEIPETFALGSSVFYANQQFTYGDQQAQGTLLGPRTPAAKRATEQEYKGIVRKKIRLTANGSL